jgi:hypothetical protein
MPPDFREQFVSGRGLKQFDVRVVNDFMNDVSNGKVEGWRRLGWAGSNPVATQDVEETLWSVGGKRNIQLLKTTPQDIYISSTDENDNAPVIIIVLDSKGRLDFRIVILNGQNQVLVPGGSAKRYLIHETVLTSGFQSNGTLYVAIKDEAISGGVPALDKTLGSSPAGANISWNGFLSVPDNSIIKVIDIYITPNTQKRAEIYLNNKLKEEIAFVKPPPFETGQSFFYDPPPLLDAGGDVELSVIARDTGVKATAYSDVILIDENYI